VLSTYRVILVTNRVPGRWDSHPHLGVVLLTVPAFGPWDDRAATSRSRTARRQFELRYPAARGNRPYAPNQPNKKPNAPPASCAQVGRRNFSTRRSDLRLVSLRSSTCGTMDCAWISSGHRHLRTRRTRGLDRRAPTRRLPGETGLSNGLERNRDEGRGHV